jgi:DNA-binding MarR family transcriptional regulator
MQWASETTTAIQLDELAEALPQRASALSRLFIARTTVPMSRTEVGVLLALRAGPVRITDLAKREAVTQPAISLLVNRLEERGWLRRLPDPADRRVVLVALTAEGTAALDELRAQYRALLHEEMASLTPDEVDTLAAAVEILDRMITRLQHVEHD